MEKCIVLYSIKVIFCENKNNTYNGTGNSQKHNVHNEAGYNRILNA